MPRPQRDPRAAVLVALLVAAGAVVGGCGGADGKGEAGAKAQTISFQKPEDAGPDPFTKPADVGGSRKVRLSDSGSQQPFGGSGSNRVCDRDKLIRFLARNPNRMREWARVLGIHPTLRAVKKYIAKLHPVTLTRDTQITNHAFRNGVAVPFQAILQAGTAVLVDRYGAPVVRCYCGNPLKPAVFTSTAKCSGCPAHYTPPKQCRFGRRSDYDSSYYRRDYYANGDYDEVFIRRFRSSPYAKCYRAYPDPPVVTIVDVYRPPPEPAAAPTTTPATPPPQQDTGLQCDPPRSQLEAERCAESRGTSPQTTPAPPPQTTPQPAPTPDICSDGIDNEGVPGLVDGDDPNCQR